MSRHRRITDCSYDFCLLRYMTVSLSSLWPCQTLLSLIQDDSLTDHKRQEGVEAILGKMRPERFHKVSTELLVQTLPGLTLSSPEERIRCMRVGCEVSRAIQRGIDGHYDGI